MALPSKLKNYNVFNDGNNYMGQVPEVTLPKLTRKMEDYRAGGMNGSIKIDYGQDVLEMDWTCGGLMKGVLDQYGTLKHDGVQLRFAGAYQAEDADTYDAVEIVVRGRHSEIDMGSAKPAGETEWKIKTAISYYKLSINGQVEIEIDIVNMIEIVNGTDLLQKLRQAIGL